MKGKESNHPLRHPVLLAMHAALLLIVAGALVTHFFSKTTELRIYEGETNTQLPFSVKLESFSVVSHPDSDLPADYVCVIEVDDGKSRETAEVSVNRVYRKDGYKFVLKGHDMFYTGASFIVTRDPWGTGLVFAGYILLLLSMAGFFFVKDTLFRSALSRINSKAPRQ